MTGTDNDWRLLLEPGASIADFRTVDDHVTAADRRDGHPSRRAADRHFPRQSIFVPRDVHLDSLDVAALSV